MALGESRDLRVLPHLSEALETAVDTVWRGALLRSIALLRQEEAFQFLMEWLDDATPRTRQEAREALEPFRNETG
jgi:HEAT repeat protein